MKSRWFLLFALFFLIACAKEEPPKNDFGLFCDTFSRLTAIDEYASMSPQERDAILQEKLSEKLPADSNAVVAWTAISNAEPQYRYSLMQDAAAAASVDNWTCPGMAKEGANVGQFGS